MKGNRRYLPPPAWTWVYIALGWWFLVKKEILTLTLQKMLLFERFRHQKMGGSPTFRRYIRQTERPTSHYWYCNRYFARFKGSSPPTLWPFACAGANAAVRHKIGSFITKHIVNRTVRRRETGSSSQKMVVRHKKLLRQVQVNPAGRPNCDVVVHGR